MARGNLLQIKAAGEGYFKFSPQGLDIKGAPRKKKKTKMGTESVVKAIVLAWYKSKLLIQVCNVICFLN